MFFHAVKKFVHVYLINAAFFKAILQHFKILNELVFQLSIDFSSLNGNRALKWNRKKKKLNLIALTTLQDKSTKLEI
ncbi:hypothetical protein BpHYR1_036886 [Brachionus plicatilis]|uniref:Uncharacterized protein n=1 Tax=Brachionus plicatilis TaxID=10195 RepID=A0A3M7QT97_BRAPC|nr:hypothetical protein BpHYR1_036886 [Brachionus plicatilis]